MQSFISRTVVIVLVPAAQLLVGEVGAQSLQDSVTGHAEFVNIPGNHVRFSLSAVRHADGRVSGELQSHVETAAGEFLRNVHGTVICFTVNGNIARVGGIVDKLTGIPLVPPGPEFFMTIIDNGEGNKEPPDLASNARGGPTGSAVTHCTTGITPVPVFPVDRGNLQVRPTSP